jgi:hypothetical protein
MRIIILMGGFKKERCMPEDHEVLQIIYNALQQQDPQLLIPLHHYFVSWESMIELRDRLSGIIINPAYYDILVEWLYDPSSTISRTAKIVTTFLNDRELFIMVCNDFLQREAVEFQDFPYQLTYNFSEYEFHINFPGAPGWGVSH